MLSSSSIARAATVCLNTGNGSRLGLVLWIVGRVEVGLGLQLNRV